MRLADILPCLLLALPVAAQPATRGDEPASSSAEAEAEPEPAPTGTVEGRVRYAGTAPLRLKTFTNSVDPEACGERVASRAVQAGRRGALADVLVEVRTADGALVAGPRLTARAEPLEISLARCSFEPYLVLVPPGSRLELLNPDGVLHEVRALSLRNEPVAARLQRFRRRAVLGSEHFRRPEKLKVSCDRHSWSGGWWVISENPLHDLTDEDGRYEIADLEAGTYLVTAWHGEFGTLEKEALLGPGESLTLDFEFR